MQDQRNHFQYLFRSLALTPLDKNRVDDLEARLREAEETIEAIRNGEVDAVVVGGPSGQKVYTLENADRPYRVLIEQMQEGAVTMGNDGTVLYCNQRFATLVGADRENIIGKSAAFFIGRGEQFDFVDLLKQRSGIAISTEFVLTKVSGETIPVNISLVQLQVDEGMPPVICSVVTDLTQIRRRSDELIASNSRLAAEIEDRIRAEDSLQIALDAAGMGSWDLDLQTDTARRSPRHDEIFGYSQLLPEWGLRNALEAFLPDEREAVAGAFDRAKETGFLEFHNRIKRPTDNEVRWLYVKGRTYYEAGRPVRIAGVVADVTDRRIIEDQLRQSQKMEAIGQLTGGIAHDFNNLLMIIGGSLDMLSRKIPIDKQIQRLLDAARQGVVRGAKLNQQLLAFARRQDLHVEVFSINDLIETFIDLLYRAVGEMVRVTFVPASQCWDCRTDPHQLETAILNLSINSRDAMPKGGSLIVTTNNFNFTESEASKFDATPGQYVVVSVSDTGEGMEPATIARVFEPFFTTKEVGKGTGLGLSQVYGFAKQSNGFVSIESKPGQGTTVSIHLPRTNTKRALTLPTGSTETHVFGHGRILLVEDDNDVRGTTTEMLRDLGYFVIEAASGREAISVLQTAEAIDLVFTDVIMTDGMNGIEVAREAAAIRPGLPVLLTSGYTAQRALSIGFAEDLRVLRKPYGQAELSQAVREAIFSRVDDKPARR